MRNKCKVKNISTLTSASEIETEINTQLTKGWQFVQIVVMATKTYAIFIKAVAL